MTIWLLPSIDVYAFPGRLPILAPFLPHPISGLEGGTKGSTADFGAAGPRAW